MSMSKKPLNRDDILGVKDIIIEKVHVPEWLDGYVYVKGMTGQEREEFEEIYRGDNEGIINIRAQLASMSICDEEGILLFSLNDAEELGKKSASALLRVFDAARRLSGLGQEEKEKNSEEMEADPSSGSASG